MIPDALLDELRARLPVSEVVGRRVKLQKAGREWKGLSPFNQERTPSFFVNDQKQFWHDFSSGRHGDIFKFVMLTEGVGFRDAIERCVAMAGRPVELQFEPEPAPKPPNGDNADEAISIWSEAVHPAGTSVAAYLECRGVPLPDEAAGGTIRFHPACKFGLRVLPCMIALVRNIQTNRPQAIYRTAIEFEATGEIKIDGVERLAFGPTHNGAIKLTPDDTVTTCLGIGEGVESVLSMRLTQEFGTSPVWSLMVAGNVRAFPVLPGIGVLWLAVDNDASHTGQEAAHVCTERWTAAGQEVIQIVPHKTGDDLNDLARRAKR